VLTLLYLKNVLYWPEDDLLRSKHVAVMLLDFSNKTPTLFDLYYDARKHKSKI